jgi:hypothetical protein
MAKTKTVGQLKKQLQPIFNEYIRLRDEGKPCISCGSYNKLQAGHFWAVGGYDGLRFDEDNVHGECARCNCWDESHLIPYSDNLKTKIGDNDFNALKQRAADYKRLGYKFSRTELEDLITHYKQIVKELKGE